MNNLRSPLDKSSNCDAMQLEENRQLAKRVAELVKDNAGFHSEVQQKRIIQDSEIASICLQSNKEMMKLSQVLSSYFTNLQPQSEIEQQAKQKLLQELSKVKERFKSLGRTQEDEDVVSATQETVNHLISSLKAWLQRVDVANSEILTVQKAQIGTLLRGLVSAVEASRRRVSNNKATFVTGLSSDESMQSEKREHRRNPLIDRQLLKKIEEMKNQNEQKDLQIKQLQDKNFNLKVIQEKTSQDMSHFQQALKELAVSNNKLKEKEKEHLKSLQLKNEAISKLSEQMEGNESSRDRYKRLQLNNSELLLQMENMIDKIETLNRESLDLNRDNNDLRLSVKSLDQQISQLESKRDYSEELERIYTDAVHTNLKLTEDLKKLQKELKGRDLTIANRDKEIAQLNLTFKKRQTNPFLGEKLKNDEKENNFWIQDQKRVIQGLEENLLEKSGIINQLQKIIEGMKMAKHQKLISSLSD